MGEAIDRLEVKLAKTVVVPRHFRHDKSGKIQDVQTYTYQRRGKSGGPLESLKALFGGGKAKYNPTFGGGKAKYNPTPPEPTLARNSGALGVPGFNPDDYAVPDPDHPQYDELLGRALQKHKQKFPGFNPDDYAVPDPDQPGYGMALARALAAYAAKQARNRGKKMVQF